MQDVRENEIDKLSLTEVNQAQSFIRYKRRWPARLRALLYVGIALVLSSGVGRAMTDRETNNYWETSPTTAELYQREHATDQLIYAESNLIFGSGFALGLLLMGGGLYYFRKYNTCCEVECKLREQEIRLRAAEYPRPPSRGRVTPIQANPLSEEEKEKQYPQPTPVTSQETI